MAGDIHGMFVLLREALDRVNFDPAIDRLFLTGDLIDRGPDSHEAAEFIGQPWANAVRGDHEQALWSMYANGNIPSQRELEYEAVRNGLGWWLSAGDAVRGDTLEMISRMPVVIEIAGPDGSPFAGVVHGEVPVGMNWPTFCEQVSQKETSTVVSAIWGRTRVNTMTSLRIAGVDRVFCGHTTRKALAVFGNTIAVDTGAVLSPRRGRLTLVEAAVPWGELPRGVVSDCGCIDFRLGEALSPVV